MKKTGIIFAWLSILSLPVMLVMYAIDRFLLKGDIATGSGSSVGGLLVYAIIGVVLMTVFGAIAHVLLQDVERETKGMKYLYRNTWVPFILGFVVLLIIWGALKFINFILKAFTSKSPLDGTCDKISKAWKKSDRQYVVIVNGSERTLEFVESRSDASPDSPYYGKVYNRFRDGTGSYWRSYDGNENFFEESVTQTSRGF